MSTTVTWKLLQKCPPLRFLHSLPFAGEKMEKYPALLKPDDDSLKTLNKICTKSIKVSKHMVEICSSLIKLQLLNHDYKKSTIKFIAYTRYYNKSISNCNIFNKTNQPCILPHCHKMPNKQHQNNATNQLCRNDTLPNCSLATLE